MITQAQIDAEEFTTPLTDKQVLVLTLLVKRYPPYYNAVGRYPLLADKLAEEVATPTVKTSALKAILTQLGVIPAFVVESSGSADAQSFFSTTQNWAELAQDVLDTLYEVPVVTGAQSYAIAQRKTENLVLKDRTIFRRSETGRRW